MKKAQTWLAGLFAAQLVLAGGLFLSDLRQGAGVEPRPLLDFALQDVDRVVIDDSAKRATLQREGEDWRLPQLAGLPGNRTRIEDLLEKLAALQTRYPVASTASAHARFSVEEDKFERRVQFYRGDELLGELYLGSSPGFRLAHARRADEDEVFSLALNTFDFPGDDNDWLDKNLLAADLPTRVEGAEYTLTKDGESWRFDPPAEGLDMGKADNLVSALDNLRVLRVADEAPPGEPAVLRVQDADGEHEYRFGRDEEANRYYVQRGDHEPWFTLAQSDWQRIAEPDRAALTVPPPEAPAAEPNAEDGAENEADSAPPAFEDAPSLSTPPASQESTSTSSGQDERVSS